LAPANDSESRASVAMRWVGTPALGHPPAR
jgi:hypothetical protein